MNSRPKISFTDLPRRKAPQMNLILKLSLSLLLVLLGTSSQGMAQSNAQGTTKPNPSKTKPNVNDAHKTPNSSSQAKQTEAVIIFHVLGMKKAKSGAT